MGASSRFSSHAALSKNDGLPELNEGLVKPTELVKGVSDVVSN